MNNPIIMTEEFWANSHLSIARHYGGIQYNGEQYSIVNSKGITLRELSNPRSKHYHRGEKAIPPGEPADLVMDKWISVYKRLGRERTFQIVKEGISLKEAKKLK